MRPAPVVLFTYNRPWHLEQTIAALKGNELARDTDLIVYSDGPRGPDDLDAVDTIRGYIRALGGFRSVELRARAKNLGLAANIIDGVTTIVKEHGQAIVLEDDLVTSRYFLRYMNDALGRYEQVEQVMHVSGYMFPIDVEGLQETFFYRVPSCWGWATWERAWRYFRKDIGWLYSTFSPADRISFDLDVDAGFWRQVEANKRGRMNTWAVFWYASVFKRGGLCLHPARSLVMNIGHDGSGSNCRASRRFDTSLGDRPVTYFEERLEEDPRVLERMQLFYIGKRWGVRWLIHLLRRLRPILSVNAFF